MPEFTEPETDAAESASDSVAPAARFDEPDAEAAPEAEAESEPVVFEPDPVLLASVDLARRALLEMTAPETVGSVIGHLVEDEHVLTLHFASDLSGYPGWHWSVTIVRVDDDEPTVIETQLLPGERALLAPAWVPWSERLAEYRAAQAAAAAAAREAGVEPVSDGHDFDDASEELEIDGDDEYDDDEDEDEVDQQHADVFDGIDLDALDESIDDDDEAIDDDESIDDDEQDDAGVSAEGSAHDDDEQDDTAENGAERQDEAPAS